MTKAKLLGDGELRIHNWCRANRVTPPTVEIYWKGKCDFGVCAYYRNNVINIWPYMCAAIGTAGRQWSYPGYVVDRTPYGVLAHELGHHVDRQHGPRGGTLSHEWRPLDPAPLTGYCPNNNEWFAELFRLFVTNPDLLRCVRPKIYPKFAERWTSVDVRDLARGPRGRAPAVEGGPEQDPVPVFLDTRLFEWVVKCFWCECLIPARPKDPVCQACREQLNEWPEEEDEDPFAIDPT